MAIKYSQHKEDIRRKLNKRSNIYIKIFSVFIDELGRVILKDIGTVAEIQNYIPNVGAKTEILELESQFRCIGSDIVRVKL